MDKNRIMKDKSKISVHRSGRSGTVRHPEYGEISVHRTPENIMQPIHRDYGLMIVDGNAAITSRVNGYHYVPKRYFEHYSISHVVEGRGRLWLEDGTERDLVPGDAVIITPGTVNLYGGDGGEVYVEDTLIFIGPVADMMQKAGIIRSGVYSFGKTRRLLPIQQLFRDPAHTSQIKANIELQKLLVELYLENVRKAGMPPRFNMLLNEIKGDPARWWTVADMADYCGVSDDQIRRFFIKYTGCLPKLYVDRYKLHRAAELLADTSRSIHSIAEAFGYQDPYHFSRRFKNIMGISPQQYRDNLLRIMQR